MKTPPTEEELRRQIDELEFTKKLLPCFKDLNKQYSEEADRLRQTAGEPSREQISGIMKRYDERMSLRAIPLKTSTLTRGVKGIRARRITVVMIPLIALVLVLSIAGNAFRKPIRDFYMSLQGYTSIQTLKTQKPEYADWDGLLLPEYIPNDFHIDTTHLEGPIKIIEFQSDDNRRIYFCQSSVTSSGILDSENCDIVKPVKIQDGTGYLIQKGGITSLVWNKGDISFCLHGDVDTHTLLRMAREQS